MENVNCNIVESDRINRSVFGVILILGALIGLGRFFMFLIGAIMLAEGIIGWCGIPYLVAKFKEKTQSPKDKITKE